MKGEKMRCNLKRLRKRREEERLERGVGVEILCNTEKGRLKREQHFKGKENDGRGKEEKNESAKEISCENEKGKQEELGR